MGAKRAHVLQGLNAFGHMGDPNGHPWRQMTRIAGVPPSRLLHQVRSPRNGFANHLHPIASVQPIDGLVQTQLKNLFFCKRRVQSFCDGR